MGEQTLPHNSLGVGGGVVASLPSGLNVHDIAWGVRVPLFHLDVIDVALCTTRVRAHTHAHTRTHARTHAHTHARTHEHTHTPRARE